MTQEVDNRTWQELQTDGVTARHQASRFRQAAIIIHDALVEEALRARAKELDTLAEILEAKAAKMTRD
jgi:hypothetical protein